MKADRELKLRIKKKKLLDSINGSAQADETKMNHSAKAKRVFRLSRIFVIAICTLIFLFLLFNINYLTPSKMKEHMSAVFANLGSGEGYPYKFSSNEVQAFFPFNSGDNVILTDNELIILNSSAKPVLNYKHSMSNPIAKYSKDRILLYDQGATKAVILNQSGQILSFPNDDKIICADISNSGKSVIATRDSFKKETVRVYSFSGKELMKWEKGSGYIIETAINAGGNSIAIGLVDTENAVQTLDVLSFNVSNAKQKGHVQFQSTALYDLSFINSNDLAVLCNNKVSILNGKCEQKSEMDLPATEHLQLFADRNGHIINIYSLYNNGEYVAEVYNASLKKIFNTQYNNEVRCAYSDGSSICVLFTNKTAQTDMLSGKISYVASLENETMFVLNSRRTIFVCSNSIVEKAKAQKQ